MVSQVRSVEAASQGGWERMVRGWRNGAALAAAFVVAALLFYFAGFEQGATALFDGTTVHEFVHDARHALGFPCH